MSDFLCREISRHNQWWIPKFRYRELLYFCLQYPAWQKELNMLLRDHGYASKPSDVLSVNSSKIADRTAEIAMKRKMLKQKIDLVERTAMDTDRVLGCYIFKAVTENHSFNYMKTMYDMPCERDMFYDRRRKFFWLLSKSQ